MQVGAIKGGICHWRCISAQFSHLGLESVYESALRQIACKSVH
jgi:hypothetical protein